jgi:hypothetical protein
MYFNSHLDLKNKFMLQVIRLLKLAEPLQEKGHISLSQVETLVNLPVLVEYFREFEAYHDYSKEECNYARRVLRDDHNKEINGLSRK